MRSLRDKPWHKNASNSLVANSILAAVAAIIVQTIATDDPERTLRWIFLLVGIGAILLFIITVEKITEAFSDDNVEAYAAYSLPYNIAVLLLFCDLWEVFRFFGGMSSWIDAVVLVALGFAWWWGWGEDSKFLLFASNGEFQGYVDELEGVRDPDRKRDGFTRLFFRLRSRTKTRMEATLPHEDVYTRLGPSPIHGVGVFAIRPIPKGTKLFRNDLEEIEWVEEKEISDLPNAIRKLYEDFAIIVDGRYGCPSSFNRLTMSWYLNDSDDPNVAVDSEYRMSALRDIAELEELTIDSSKFSAQPYKNQ